MAKEGFWLGGISGVFIKDDAQVDFPEIMKLGKAFSDFQNSPYRGEWNQKWSLTFGEIRDILLEAAQLIRAREERGQ